MAEFTKRVKWFRRNLDKRSNADNKSINRASVHTARTLQLEMLLPQTLFPLLLLIASSSFGHDEILQQGKIVGGESIEITDAPYQISLQVEGFGHSCGGAVLSRYLILTAAHCVDGSDPKTLSVRAGSTISSEGGQLIQIERLLVHENFTYFTLDYDVAMLRLKTPLRFSRKVFPVPVVDGKFEVLDGAAAVVTGWGTTQEGGSLSNSLQKIVVPVVNQEMCKKAYEYFQEVTDRMFCARQLEGGEDACQGDSGGPLVIQGRLAGIVSWGNGCARENYPGIYTRLTTLHKWIQNAAKTLMFTK